MIISERYGTYFPLEFTAQEANRWREMAMVRAESGFDEFAARTVASGVPVEFEEAKRVTSLQVGGMTMEELERNGYYDPNQVLAERLLKKRFENPSEATYALLYCETVALIKKWRECLEVGPGAREMLAGAAERYREEAMELCGYILITRDQTEERENGHWWNGLFRKGVKRKNSAEKIEEWVEEHFKERKAVNGVVLMSSGRRF